MKKLISREIKSMIIPAAILLAITIITVITVSSITPKYDEVYAVREWDTALSDYFISFYSFYPSGDLVTYLPLYISGCGSAIVMGFVVYSYRSSKRKADLYQQIPFNETTYRRTRFLIGLGYTIAIVITFYLIYILIVGFSIMSEKDFFSQNSEYTHYFVDGMDIYSRGNIGSNPKIVQITYFFDWGKAFENLLLLIVITTATYFISTFFTSRSNRFVNQFFVTFLGFISLGLIGCTALTLIRGYGIDIGHREPFEGDLCLYFGYSPYHMVEFINDLFSHNPIIKLTASQSSSWDDITYYYLSDFIVYLVLGSAAFFPQWFEKEQSGEYFGSHQSSKIYQNIIFHASAAIIGLAICSVQLTNAPGQAFFVLVLYIAIYVLLTAWFEGTFKFKKSLIPMLSILAFVFVLYLFNVFTYETFDGVYITVKGDQVIRHYSW